MKKKKQYDWHFWIPEYKFQVVVPHSSYGGALKHLKEKLSYHNRPHPKIEFQFGQKPA